MLNPIALATFNIHKGVSSARTLTVPALRDAIRRFGVDLVCLQEVQGESKRQARHHATWPGQPQYEFLAESVWPEYAYGRNAVYDDGHHGNATLSRYPILRWHNLNISQSRYEQRGALHCEIAIPTWPHSLHCLNVHLGLFAPWRRRQLGQLARRIAEVIPNEAPLIVAGDFNDWTRQASALLVGNLQLQEVFEGSTGAPARTFPATYPLLALDRIYVRGLTAQSVRVHGERAMRISDHLAISATLTLSP